MDRYVPVYVKIECEETGCDYYVHGIADSNFGEKAAIKLEEHCQEKHNKRFPEWLANKE